MLHLLLYMCAGASRQHDCRTWSERLLFSIATAGAVEKPRAIEFSQSGRNVNVGLGAVRVFEGAVGVDEANDVMDILALNGGFWI